MATKKPQPPCVTIYPWLNENIGTHYGPGMTGTDVRCLNAAVMIMEAYSYNRTEALAKAFGACAMQMQDQYQYLAFHCIAHIMEWETRAEVWELAGLEPLKNVPVCAWEPGGSQRPRPQPKLAA